MQLFNTGSSCSAWQTYKVESDGHLQFVNDVESSVPDSGPYVSTTIPTDSSNNKFAYGAFPYSTDLAYYQGSFAAFSKTSAGGLEVNPSFAHTDPTPKCSNGYCLDYHPIQAQADPNGHLAVEMIGTGINGYFNYPQFASYTINPTTGAIVSTNTWNNMPFPTYSDVRNMSMSPSGKLLAVAEHSGMDIFHFNGAAPITIDTAVILSGVDIDQVKWDANNHLYALSYDAAQLNVFTATPNLVSRAAASPYALPKSPYGVTGMIVVSK